MICRVSVFWFPPLSKYVADVVGPMCEVLPEVVGETLLSVVTEALLAIERQWQPSNIEAWFFFQSPMELRQTEPPDLDEMWVTLRLKHPNATNPNQLLGFAMRQTAGQLDPSRTMNFLIDKVKEGRL